MGEPVKGQLVSGVARVQKTGLPPVQLVHGGHVLFALRLSTVQPVTPVAVVYWPGAEDSKPSFTQGATFTTDQPPFFLPVQVFSATVGVCG